jgi:hypothetical protein
MESSHLKPEQVERMFAVLARQRDYLSRLIERMRIRRFPPDDPVYRAAIGAYEKTSNLCVVMAKFRNVGEGRQVAPVRGDDDDDSLMNRRPWAG